MPAQFQLEVFFSGLVFFLTDKPAPDRSITKVTHVILRDGRHDHHDYAFSHEDHPAHSRMGASDLDHKAEVSIIRRNDRRDYSLDDEWMRFEWRGPDGEPVWHQSPTKPFGKPADTSADLPGPSTSRSFYWIASMNELDARNPVITACYDSSKEKPGVIACVPLAGGELQTTVFAWAHELQGGLDSQSKVRWISKLPFKAAPGMTPKMSRAIAEGVTWRVEPPSGAATLHILKEPFDGSTSPTELEGFDLTRDSRALVGMTNYPMARPMPSNRVHPGRDKDHGSMHFEMLYDLLVGYLPPGARLIPWVPSTFQGNGILYNSLEPCPVDTPRNLQPSAYTTAADAFCKEDRPICAGCGGGG